MSTTSTETSTTDAGTTTTDSAATQDQAAATQEAATSTTETSTEAQTVEALPEWAQTEIRRARDEAAKTRAGKNSAVEQAVQETVDKILAAAGRTPEGGDQPPSVEQLTKDLADQKATGDKVAADLREARAELVVWRNATNLGVDAAAVTDSRAFERALADLDPASETFAEDVKKAAQAAAENNPKLKAAQAAGKSGAELNGGTGEGAITQDQYKHMSGAERNALARTNPNLYAQLSGRA